jgi:hypothetical protein
MDDEYGAVGGMSSKGNQNYFGKTCPSATLSTTNPTWPNPGRYGEKPGTNRLIYDTATGKFEI